MTVKGIHHVAVAVRDLDEAIEEYGRLFGAAVEHRSMVGAQGVEAVGMLMGESRLEFLSATGSDTPVGKFLASRGPGMHHVAYEVDDVRDELAALDELGVELIDREPRRGLYGMEIAFIHPDSTKGVLTELVSHGR
jgi:methylmalonyl-CoA/ethylmalonyl-CoA epimerase